MPEEEKRDFVVRDRRIFAQEHSYPQKEEPSSKEGPSADVSEGKEPSEKTGVPEDKEPSEKTGVPEDKEPSEKTGVPEGKEPSEKTGVPEGKRPSENTSVPEGKRPSEKKADARAETQLPAINFATFIFSLHSSVLLNLGLIGDPATGKKTRNLLAAKQTIDILGMLEEKTRGNLTTEEQGMLKDILYDLRLAYVREKG